MTKKRIIAALCFSIALFIIVSCTSQQKTATALTEEDSVVVSESASIVVFRTYYELAQYAEIVILGRVHADEVGIINTSRNPQDRSKPNTRSFTVVPVYRVDVEEYLKGEGPDTIYVAQWEGNIRHGKTPSPAEIEQARLSSKDKTYSPLDASGTYLMFLITVDVWDDYNIPDIKQGNLFIKYAEPWLFDATDKENISVVSAYDVNRLFPPQSLSDIIAQMGDSKLSPSGDPYPVPEETRKEGILEKSEPTAYP